MGTTPSHEAVVAHRMRTSTWPASLAARPGLIVSLWHALCHESGEPLHHALGHELTPLLSRAVWLRMGGAPRAHRWTGMVPAQQAWLHAFCTRSARCAMKRGADWQPVDPRSPKHHRLDDQTSPENVRGLDDDESQDGAGAQDEAKDGPADDDSRDDGGDDLVSRCADEVRTTARERNEFVVGIIYGFEATAWNLTAQGLLLDITDAKRVFAVSAVAGPGMWRPVHSADGVVGVVVLSIACAQRAPRATWLLERALAAAAWVRHARAWLHTVPETHESRQTFQRVVDRWLPAKPVVHKLDALRKAIDEVTAEHAELETAAWERAANELTDALVPLQRTMMAMDTDARAVVESADTPVDVLAAPSHPRRPPFGVNAMRVFGDAADRLTRESDMVSSMFTVARRFVLRTVTSTADDARRPHAIRVLAGIEHGLASVEYVHTSATKANAAAIAYVPAFMANQGFVDAASMAHTLPMDIVELIRLLATLGADLTCVGMAWAALRPHLQTAAYDTPGSWQTLLDDVRGTVRGNSERTSALLARAVGTDDAAGHEGLSARWFEAHDAFESGDLSVRVAAYRLDPGDDTWQAIVGAPEQRRALALGALAMAPTCAKFEAAHAFPAMPWAQWVWGQLHGATADRRLALKTVRHRVDGVVGLVRSGAMGEFARYVQQRALEWLRVDATATRPPAEIVLLYADPLAGSGPVAFPTPSAQSLIGDIESERSDASVHAARALHIAQTRGEWPPDLDAFRIFHRSVVARFIHNRNNGLLGDGLMWVMYARHLGALAARPRRWTFMGELLRADVDVCAVIRATRGGRQPAGSRLVYALGPDGAGAWARARQWHVDPHARVDWTTSFRDRHPNESVLSAPPHMPTWRAMVDEAIIHDDRWLRDHGQRGAEREAGVLPAGPLDDAALDVWLTGAVSAVDAVAIISMFLATLPLASVPGVLHDLWRAGEPDAARLVALGTRTRPFDAPATGAMLRDAMNLWIENALNKAAVPAVAWLVLSMRPAAAAAGEALPVDMQLTDAILDVLAHDRTIAALVAADARLGRATQQVFGEWPPRYPAPS